MIRLPLIWACDSRGRFTGYMLRLQYHFAVLDAAMEVVQ